MDFFVKNQAYIKEKKLVIICLIFIFLLCVLFFGYTFLIGLYDSDCTVVTPFEYLLIGVVLFWIILCIVSGFILRRVHENFYLKKEFGCKISFLKKQTIVFD